MEQASQSFSCEVRCSHLSKNDTRFVTVTCIKIALETIKIMSLKLFFIVIKQVTRSCGIALLNSSLRTENFHFLQHEDEERQALKN